MTDVRRVAGAGVGLALERWGGDARGPALLMLHGVSRCGRGFAGLLPPLLPRFDVHTLDHRGHGASDRAASYLVRDYAADCIAVVERELSGPVVLQGHSLGSLVALLVAAALPGRVKALVLEDPPGPAFLAGVSRSDYAALFGLYQRHAGSPLPVGELARVLADAELTGESGPPRRFGAIRDAAGVRFTAACLGRVDPAVFAPLLSDAWLESVDLLEAARRVVCPVLLLRADPALGGMLPDGDVAALVAALGDVAVIDFSAGSPWGRAGHGILGQTPEAMARFVIPFLESTSVADRGGAA